MPGIDSSITSQLEIFLSCKNLPKLDVFSESDPMCVVYMKHGAVNYAELGRTERIGNNPNPAFAKSIQVEYNFEMMQIIKIGVYDVDAKTSQLSAHDCVGEVEFILGNLVAAPGQQISLRMSKYPTAQVILRCEEIVACSQVLKLQLAGVKLDKKDFFGKSDPFIEIERAREDGSWAPVHRTEIIESSLNPTWKPFEIAVQKLCNADLSRPLRFSCYDFDKNDAPDLIGRATTSVSQLTSGAVSFTLVHDKNSGKPREKVKSSGELRVVGAQLESRHSFLDYIRGGCEISLNVAIDFTGSNGDPRHPSSLHFLAGPQQLNPYERALEAVGSVLEPYDSDHQYRVWGYGARIPNGQVSHCFSLTLDESRPEVKGLDGLMGVYRHALNHVALSGPTLFEQVISTAARNASRAFDQGKQHYDVLLIITDGVINDMAQTINAIVHASNVPLSIIIIGVGNADFSAMNALDGDGRALCGTNAQFASRDIVQFVPMNSVEASVGTHVNATSDALARQVLAELPGQLVTYMKKHNIDPLPPRRAIQ